MLYQYHCGCCNQVVKSDEKDCSNCGSHNIRSPFGFWIFCIIACLVTVIVFKIAHVYLQDHQEIPVQPSVLEVINSK